MAQNYRFVCLVAVTTTFAPRPGDGGAAVEATSLYRFFRAGDAQTLALQGVSISISAGELVVVSGPSGSGKCLAGIDNPDGGIIRTNGQRLSHRPEHVQAQMRSAHRHFVPDRKSVATLELLLRMSDVAADRRWTPRTSGYRSPRA